MCGRYLHTSPPEAAARLFGIDIRENYPPRCNISPTQPIAAVIVNEQRERAFRLLRWGFIPSWAKKEYHEKMGSKPLINARGETIAEKPVFRNAFKRRRCLIPADGFYEWKTEKDGKQPYLIQTREETLFAFAGVWETAVDPDGGEIDTAAIITFAAGADLKPLHSREPVVIETRDFDDWLDGDETRTKDAGKFIKAAPSGFWKFHAVSKAVNNARNEGEELGRAIGQIEMF
jgi:putative SOS response-associated peptidase YedK